MNFTELRNQIAMLKIVDAITRHDERFDAFRHQMAAIDSIIKNQPSSGDQMSTPKDASASSASAPDPIVISGSGGPFATPKEAFDAMQKDLNEKIDASRAEMLQKEWANAPPADPFAKLEKNINIKVDARELDLLQKRRESIASCKIIDAINTRRPAEEVAALEAEFLRIRDGIIVTPPPKDGYVRCDITQEEIDIITEHREVELDVDIHELEQHIAHIDECHYDPTDAKKIEEFNQNIQELESKINTLKTRVFEKVFFMQ